MNKIFKKTQHPGFAKWIYGNLSECNFILDLDIGVINEIQHTFTIL